MTLPAVGASPCRIGDPPMNEEHGYLDGQS